MHLLDQRHATVAIDSIHMDERNPNQGDLVAIGKSIDANGFYGAVLAQEGTGRIIAGAHRWQAAKQAGAAEIPVTYVDVDDERARRIMLADNRTARLGSDDPEALAALLQELTATPAALSGTGYDGDALDALLADLGQGRPEMAGDPDAVPEVAAEPVSRRGDLWVLGEHRLLVGDSTDRADVERLMDGRAADALIADPPYGIGYHSNRPAFEGGRRLIDREFGADAPDTTWIAPWASALGPASCTYLWTRWDVLHMWRTALEDAGFEVRQRLIWDKLHWTMGNLAYYGSQTEDVLFATKGDPVLRWEQRRGNLLATASKAYMPEARTSHPTQKPIAVMQPLVEDSVPPGGLLADPFAGSGTLVACAEALGRVCYACEIDPRYADVTVQRWQDLTGKTAVRERVDDDARVLTS